MKISLITPTGGRPLAFELCELWMSRQTVQPDEWIVVDDYEIPTKCTMGQTIIRRTPFWKPGDITLNENLIEALKIVTGDIIFIIEDDDWYKDTYIENMVNKLKNYDLAGEGYTPYFDINTYHYYTWKNGPDDKTPLAALFRTGFTKKILSQILLILDFTQKEKKLVDIYIWRYALCKKLIFINELLSLGIKGLPGRPHILGMNTVLERKIIQKADNINYLLKWMKKEDVEFYKKVQSLNNI
jgi:hypothetical protein